MATLVEKQNANNVAAKSKNSPTAFNPTLAAAQLIKPGDDKTEQTGHKPGADYKAGTVVAPGKIYLDTDDTGKTHVTGKEKHNLYFKHDDSVTLVKGSSKDHDNWIEVEGTAHYDVDKKTTKDVPKTKGWIKRDQTSMTLGLFEGLDIQDKTVEFKDITLSPEMDPVQAVVLHNTGGDKATGTESEYRGKMAHKDTEGKPKPIHVAAQYLISENGETSEIVPINHMVGHTVGDKYSGAQTGKPLPQVPPQLWKVYHAKDDSAAEMEKVRKDIDKHYSTLTTQLLTDHRYHYLKNMSNADLYNFLNDPRNNWNLFPHTVKNQTAIGIEVVGAPKNIADDLSFSTNKRHDKTGIIAEIDRLIKKGDLSEADKNTALQSDGRKTLEEKPYKDPVSKAMALNDFDKKVLKDLQDRGWVINGVAIAAPETFKALKAQGKADQFLAEVNNLNLSPALKAQLLKTTQRAEIQSKLKNAKTPAEKAGYEKQIDNLNAELFSFLRASGFYVYVDINGSQKLASWLLVKNLAKQFNLDINKDIFAHPEIDSKGFGEGQNNLEFIHAMADFETKVNALKAESTKKPEMAKSIADYSNVIVLLNKGDFKNAAIKTFLDNFYQRKAAFDQLYNKYK